MTCDCANARPKLIDEVAEILENKQLSGPLWNLVLRSPEIAATVQPGQFVHLQIPGMNGHILRRPFSVYGVDAPAGTMNILYQVVGQGSAHLTTLPAGTKASMIGPVGNSWKLPAGTRRVLLVVGGVGAAPLEMFARDLHEAGVELDVCMGAQTKDALVLRGWYEALLGAEPICATDDGSYGHAGFVTGPAADLLAKNAYDLVCCCGPEPLMRIVAGLAADAGVACQVSLEKRMACGVGACLSCVVDTVDGRKRSCVDGPVFDAAKVVW